MCTAWHAAGRPGWWEGEAVRAESQVGDLFKDLEQRTEWTWLTCYCSAAKMSDFTLWNTHTHWIQIKLLNTAWETSSRKLTADGIHSLIVLTDSGLVRGWHQKRNLQLFNKLCITLLSNCHSVLLLFPLQPGLFLAAFICLFPIHFSKIIFWDSRQEGKSEGRLPTG